MARTTLTTVLTFILLTVAFASDPKKPNADHGRNQFRQTCKNCHSKGSVGGEVTPLSKTVAQWRSYFEKAKHAQSPLANVIPERQLRDVEAFLVAHAADSEQPEICGR